MAGGFFLKKLNMWRLLRITPFYETTHAPNLTALVATLAAPDRPLVRVLVQWCGRRANPSQSGAIHLVQRPHGHCETRSAGADGSSHAVGACRLHGRGGRHLGCGACAG